MDNPLTTLTVRERRDFRDATGIELRSWMLLTRTPESRAENETDMLLGMAAILWLMRRRDDRAAQFDTFADYDPARLDAEIDEFFPADDQPAPEVGPLPTTNDGGPTAAAEPETGGSKSS